MKLLLLLLYQIYIALFSCNAHVQKYFTISEHDKLFYHIKQMHIYINTFAIQ